MSRTLAILSGVLLACAHAATPEHHALVRQGDCAEVLRAADQALSWNPSIPDVIVGRLTVSLDHVTTATSTTVEDAKGGNQRVPAVQHRFVARAEAQVGLGGKTRALRASEEAPDLNISSGDPGAAASGAGNPAKIAACEKLLANPPARESQCHEGA